MAIINNCLKFYSRLRQFQARPFTDYKLDSKVFDKVNCDIIGPPNKVSNLRPIVFNVPKEESELEKQLRLKRDEVQKWNEAFWANHNTMFFEQKENYTMSHAMKNNDNVSSMTSDEMSVFYKKFLDEHWKTHQIYNLEWYHKNVELLFLAFRVAVHKISPSQFFK